MKDSTSSAKLTETEASSCRTRKCDRFLDRLYPGIRTGNVLVLPHVPLSTSFQSYLYQRLECIYCKIVEATHESKDTIDDGVNQRRLVAGC